MRSGLTVYWYGPVDGWLNAGQAALVIEASVSKYAENQPLKYRQAMTNPLETIKRSPNPRVKLWWLTPRFIP